MKSVILIVLDGFGVGSPNAGNPIYLVNPINITNYTHTFPYTTLKASGESVGLPRGEVGNTEVGHINLGAGRIVYQDLPRINMSIADGSFYENKTFLRVVEVLNSTGGTLHLLGLVSNGSVHSSIEHLRALLFFAKEKKLKKVLIHAITDGRDSPPQSAWEVMKEFDERYQKTGIGRFASVMGRYYAMDRDKRWDRIEKAYMCLTRGEGQKSDSAYNAIQAAYSQGKTDEFIEPTNITENGQPPELIKEGDAVIFFNYRIDRPRQLTKSFVLDDFENEANATFGSYDPYEVKYFKTHLQSETLNEQNKPFTRREKIKNLFFVTMTEYERRLPVEIAFPQIVVTMPLGRVISLNNMSQLRMSESEKERFVTFYFNGQRDLSFPQEYHHIIPSPRVATYDQKPEMSAYELTDALLKHMDEQKYQFILINFANPDMVGHTGNLEASVKAVKVIDECLGKIVNKAILNNTTVFITADHGNVEQKINPFTNQISTEHTDNPVPFIAIGKHLQNRAKTLQTGILADIAPTIVAELGIPKPADMTGRNLLAEVR